jgi:replicative DNA helicase
MPSVVPGNGVRKATDVVSELEQGTESVYAVATGFSVLDNVLDGGLSARDLTVLGGVPGVGKTTMALQWARNMALGGRQVVYACYDHDDVSLLVRLLLLEVGELTGGSPGSSLQARGAIRAVSRGEQTLIEAAEASHLVESAHERVRAYGDRLLLLAASREGTGLPELSEAADTVGTGGALIVDYLQKIPTDESISEAIRVDKVAAGLKEIALTKHVAVLATVIGDKGGLDVRRLTSRHLRGASGIAYEADVILMLNEKSRAVSKLHSAYDPIRSERFKQQIIISIDKNRHGPANINLEFTKDFAHSRFNPEGQLVEEQIVDDLMFPE